MGAINQNEEVGSPLALPPSLGGGQASSVVTRLSSSTGQLGEVGWASSLKEAVITMSGAAFIAAWTRSHGLAFQVLVRGTGTEERSLTTQLRGPEAPLTGAPSRRGRNKFPLGAPLLCCMVSVVTP